MTIFDLLNVMNKTDARPGEFQKNETI